MGTAALVQALQFNDILETLVMDTNSIGDEGAELLAGYLAGPGSSSVLPSVS
jgi:hypothetical protein